MMGLFQKVVIQFHRISMYKFVNLYLDKQYMKGKCYDERRLHPTKSFPKILLSMLSDI